MQEALSITPLRGRRGPDHALTDSLLTSATGRALVKASEDQRQMRNGSLVFDPPERRELKYELRKMAKETAQPNWDGDGAAAIEQSTMSHALRFVDALPMGFAEPDPGVDPDGEISFSWIGGKGHRLSISLGPTGRISYAYRIGPRRRNGTEWFGDSIPEELQEYIGTFPIFS